ncbi:MAG: DedA family protein [Thiomonas sp.]|uniref:DedA family protein n=1 Tax=Thiomonas sp. TaxID=2047785 RepID=UPI002A360182|nr:DedA family protein [Thiomonas sp.]MDY0330988.1 DedA family protein [Thiomonas sp.]
MIEDFVRHYGYAAVALGALAEGETVLLLAGYGAHRGWLEWPLVVVVAAIAATLGDQFFFFMGRWFGPHLLRRFSSLERQLPRVQRLLHRGAPWAIVSVRFLYGLRIAGPVLIGIAGVAPWRFVVFNTLGAFLWAPLFTGLGWFFGAGVAQLASRLQWAEEILLALAVVIALIAWRIGKSRQR